MDFRNGWQPRDRSDRHVRHARLCAAAGSAYRLAQMTEESLRLAALPGEHEGRCYYFRRVRVAGLPPGGERGRWLACFQQALSGLAAQAVHAADARAPAAPAVFFRGESEAVEMLLGRILSRRIPTEWFWPMVAAGEAPEAAAVSSPGQAPGFESVPLLVERLRAGPASWVAVAAALFSPVELDLRALLESVAPARVEVWLREIPGWQSPPTGPAPRLSPPVRRALQQTARAYGVESPRAVWLAAMAVLLDAPAELASGTAVGRAREVLRGLARAVPISAETTLPQAGASGPGKTESPHTEGPLRPARPRDADVHRTERAPLPPPQSGGTPGGMPSGPVAPGEAPGPEPSEAAPLAAEPVRGPVEAAVPDRVWQCAGIRTRAAGLFFLLNALEWLGLPEALDAGLFAASPAFVFRLLLGLTEGAGAAPDDPVVEWLRPVCGRAGDEVGDQGALFTEPSWWPAGFHPPQQGASTARLMRVWTVAVRRWCLRYGRITVREVVSRPGIFSVNRTDLDTSLPLEQADVRIRKAGLDLDPGWVPWFGRVVRFHYLYREELHA